MKINRNNAQNYQYLLILSTIYITLALTTLIFDLKIFSFFGLPMVGGVLLFPIVFVVSDIITEIYGYQVSRQLIWLLIAAQLFFGISIGLFAHLPNAKPIIPRDMYFNQTLSVLLTMVFGAPIIIIISSFLNIFILSKFKILLKGKYFWSRCVFSSAMGDAACSLMAIAWMFFGAISIEKILLLTGTAYLMKLIYTFVFAIPATSIVKKLKYIENPILDDENTSLNPFKFLIQSRPNENDY